MGRKLGGGSAAFFGKGRWVPIAQCVLDRGPPPCQVASWSIQPYGHNRQLCFWGFLYIKLRDVITSFIPILTHLPVSIAMQLVFCCTCVTAIWLHKLLFVVNRPCTTLRILVTVTLHLSVDWSAIMAYFVSCHCSVWYVSTNYVMLLTALPDVLKISIPIAWWK